MAVIENDVIKVTVSNSSSKNVIRVSPGVAALSSVSISLNELNNVDTSGITNGQTIVYNNGSFVAGDSGAVESINGEFPDAEGDVAIDFSVDGLSDVTAPSPSEGDILKYESNRWVNDSLGKADVGLNNVDNTSDSDKPVSTATQTALDAKANTSAVPVSLNDLSDVSIVGTPTKNTALLYDETANAFKFQPSFTNRFEDEAENNKQAILPFVERVYTVKTDGDGIFIDSQSDTPTAGKVIKRKIYHKVGFIASGDLIGDYTLVHTFADDIAYSATESVFEGFRDGDTYGTAPFTLIQTWEEVTAAPSFTGLLNETYGSGAEAAYSTRRLNGNYSGDCMTIRRASDNTTQSIGFVGEEIDESAIETFCSGTTCTVSEWKDQSGNGNNATATTARQPTIYTGGALVKEGGRLALLLDGADDGFNLSAIGAASSKFAFITHSVDSSDTAWSLLAETTSTDVIPLGQSGSGSAGVFAYTMNNIYSGGALISPNTRGDIYNAYTSAGQSLTTLDFSGDAVGTLFNRSSFVMQGKAQEVVLYASDKSTDRTDIESNIGDYFTQNTPLLDTYSGAAAAYSLRLLDSTYTGALVEVYNGSSYADIGANVFGELDTVALAAHCGSSDGFVSKWYDQSGNTNTAAQTNTANMPKIYDGTTGVITENGKPVILSETGGQFLKKTGFSATTIEAFVTAKTSSVFNYSAAICGSIAQYILIAQENSTTTILNQDSGTVVYRLDTASYSPTNRGDVYADFEDNQRLLGVSFDATSWSNLYLGYTGNTLLNMFSFQEIILYGSDQSTNRANIEDNINTFYNIYS